MRRLLAFVAVGILAASTPAVALRATIPSAGPAVPMSLGVPSVGSCGTSPSLGSGSTDSSGFINTGSVSTTSCVLNFSHTLSAIPNCTVSTNSITITAGVTAVSASSVTFSPSVSLVSGKLYYVCLGGQ